MEWTMPVNEILKDEITKVGYDLMPPHFEGDVTAVRKMYNSLSKIINEIGAESAAAQKLNRVITTADKLRSSPSYVLYFLKDAKANGGKGAVIGILKVGRKHLFLMNEEDKMCQVQPLCVLDFFVKKDRQRAGYGKMLFDYMLNDMQISINMIAVDGPSLNMENFLRKNYGVDVLLRQSNNFAVTPEFFKLVPDISKSSTTLIEKTTLGRFAAPKPQSAIASVIHGDCSYYDISRSFKRTKSKFN